MKYQIIIKLYTSVIKIFMYIPERIVFELVILF
jgi:hypothetical protein